MLIADLRSDTVTRPTPEMFEAMQSAALGDDVLGDDPTVIELEQLAAKMVGKEAAVFVPSGTMGNQMAIATHTKPGDAIIVEEEAHVIYYEVGAPAVFANVLTWTLPSDRGVMDPSEIRRRITKRNIHTPGTTLICIEDTHNRAGGTVIPLDVLAEYRKVADEFGIKIHVDGARIFNAAVAQGVHVSEITKHVDTVNFCLSKGLRAPVGSILAGPAEFIDAARFWRKRLGGGMRQAGILAACGLISLTKLVDRLAEDHARARVLVTELGSLPGISCDPDANPTNLVMLNTEKPAAEWAAALHEKGVWAMPAASHRLRLVTHADFTDEHLEFALGVFRSVVI